MKETFIPILVLLILYLVLSLNYKKENFETLKKYQKRQQSIYTSEVLNPEIHPRIYAIAHSIIKKVNIDLKLNYQMGKFDNVIGDSDNDGNPRYILDFFVYLMNNQHVTDVTRRLIVDVTIFPKSGELQINTLNFSNAAKDQGPQHLPLKDDDAGQLIIKPELTGKDYNPSGGPHLKQFRGKLEYGKFDSPVELDEINKCRDEYQDWILPLQIQEKKDLRRFPCRDYGDWWDVNGNLLTKTEENGLRKLGLKCANNFKSELKINTEETPAKESKWCYGSHNTATTPGYINGQFYPNHASYLPERPNLENNWLFKEDSGIIGFPHGGSS
jgi:hypothetical protein